MSAIRSADALAMIARVETTDSPSHARLAVVELLREALCRWGTSPRADLRRYLRDLALQLDLALGDPDEVLGDMEVLGEVAQLRTDVGVLVVPRPLLRLRVGGALAVLGVPPRAGWPRSGTVAVNDEVPRACHVRWSRDALQEISGTALHEWFGTAAPLELIGDGSLDITTAASTRASLEETWRVVGRRLRSHGAPVSSDHDLVLLGGQPGDMVGKPNALGPRTRWRSDVNIEDGIWMAARPVVGERTQPLVAAVERGAVQRMLTLPSWGAFWWAAWSRGCAVGVPERLTLEEVELRWSLPLPREVQARLDALSVGRGASQWSRRYASPSIAAAVASAAGRTLGLLEA